MLGFEQLTPTEADPVPPFGHVLLHGGQLVPEVPQAPLLLVKNKLDPGQFFDDLFPIGAAWPEFLLLQPLVGIVQRSFLRPDEPLYRFNLIFESGFPILENLGHRTHFTGYAVP